MFNSIVLSLLSPQIQNALSSLSVFELEEMITILCLDVDIQDIKQFLNNILNQKEEIPSCKAVVDLLGHNHLGVKIEVDLQDQLKVEESSCQDDVNEVKAKDIIQKSPIIHEFDEDIHELIDSIDPLPIENDFEIGIK